MVSSDLYFFRSLIGRQLGITANSMGMVFFAVPVAGIFIKPFLGGIADKYLMSNEQTFLLNLIE